VIVGIDLGTTHTLVAVLDADGPRVLPQADGSLLLPSAVAVDDAGHLLVGAAALARLSREPAAGARWFKRDMGADRRYRFGGRDWTPTELSAVVLREAKAVAERALGSPVTRAVITVPAYFQEPQRAATREAGELAGLQVVRMINEPTAAAIAHGVADPERERRVVVVDLGGGTFDVTLLEVFDGVIEVTGTGGDARLGGEDITDALWRHACAAAGLAPPGDAPGAVQALLREACEDAKRALSELDLARVRLPEAGVDTWVDAGSLVVTRALLEQLCRPLLDRMVCCIRDTLAAAKRSSRDFDEVVLAGGGTRMHAVHRRIANLFGREPVEGPDPDLAVVLGAALQAGLVTRHAAVREVVVTDVLAHSLGVEISREGEDRTHSGYFLPVLHRNTTLPVRRVERVFTLHPQQEEVRVRVFEGEHRYTRENRLLGEFVVQGLPVAPTPQGPVQAIDVGFTHDLNGLLEVEAVVQSTGKKASILIEQRAGRMTDEERARAVDALARLKVYARDLLPNRLLLEEALTRHARLSGDARALLDAPLFAFEDALAREQPEAIAAAAEALRRALVHPLLAPDTLS
jgi:molecular chaperone HscC